MAVLTDEQRAEVHALWGRRLSKRHEPLGALTKADLIAAILAMDDWIEANDTAINQAIPQPARGELTVSQKAELLNLVVRARYGD